MDWKQCVKCGRIYPKDRQKCPDCGETEAKKITLPDPVWEEE